AIARVLAARIPGLSPDQAMLAGLLHDIGVLPILTHAENSPQLRGDMITLDRLVVEYHPQIGAKILSSWKFPPSLVAVAAEHENLQRDPDGPPDLVDVVIVANLQSYLGGTPNHAQVDWSTVPAFRRLGFDTEVNTVEMTEHQDQLGEVQHLLDT
ncbi:MAG TPA: HDOD domain-containing protein, partial [Chromatiales bacterium]|nr:HDOD domain-containing protein [Chromatiales bacterium]